MFGKSIADCAQFMCLNLFEAKASVQGCVPVLTKPLAHCPPPPRPIADDYQPHAAWPCLTVAHCIFATLCPTVPHSTCRFKLYTQAGAPASTTALHDAAREQVWSRTKEILSRQN